MSIMSSSSGSDTDRGSDSDSKPIVAPPRKKHNWEEIMDRPESSSDEDDAMAGGAPALPRGQASAAATESVIAPNAEVFQVAICTCSACGIASHKACQIH